MGSGDTMGRSDAASCGDAGGCGDAMRRSFGCLAVALEASAVPAAQVTSAPWCSLLFRSLARCGMFRLSAFWGGLRGGHARRSEMAFEMHLPWLALTMWFAPAPQSAPAPKQLLAAGARVHAVLVGRATILTEEKVSLDFGSWFDDCERRALLSAPSLTGSDHKLGRPPICIGARARRMGAGIRNAVASVADAHRLIADRKVAGARSTQRSVVTLGLRVRQHVDRKET